MLLTGKEIIDMVASGRIHIDPFYTQRVNPNSYDLTLSPKLLVYDSVSLDMKTDNPTEEFEIPETGLMLYPNNIYIGSTNERCGSSEFVPLLEGKSGIGRLGIFTHVTAGVGDLGFGIKEGTGRWTLEIVVVKPVKVYPNVPFCQMMFLETRGDRSIQYQGSYRGQDGPMASRIWRSIARTQNTNKD